MNNICGKQIGAAMLKFIDAIEQFGRDLAAAGAPVDLDPVRRGYDRVRVEIDSVIAKQPETQIKDEAA